MLHNISRRRPWRILLDSEAKSVQNRQLIQILLFRLLLLLSITNLPFEANFKQSHALRISMHAHDFQPLVRFLDQLVELTLAPLLGAQRHHHTEVHLPQMMLLEPRGRARLGQNYLIDEQRGFRSATLQCGNHSADNLDCVAIAIVVKALAQDIGRAVFDGLGVEEVVLLERHAAAIILLFLCLREHLGRDILDDKVE